MGWQMLILDYGYQCVLGLRGNRRNKIWYIYIYLYILCRYCILGLRCSWWNMPLAPHMCPNGAHIPPFNTASLVSGETGGINFCYLTLTSLRYFFPMPRILYNKLPHFTSFTSRLSLNLSLSTGYIYILICIYCTTQAKAKAKLMPWQALTLSPGC